MEETTSQDYIVSELLSELKERNEKKDEQINRMHKNFIRVVASCIAAILLVIAGFLIYLNQYDFSSTTSSWIGNSAEGVYAIIDSDGNVISSDLTPEQIEELLSHGAYNETSSSGNN